MTTQTAPTGVDSQPRNAPDMLSNIDFRELIAVVISAWPIILVAALIGFGVGRYKVFVTPHTYQSDALIQIESNSNQARIALRQTAEIVDQSTELPAEIEILRSRKVLGQVARDLGLDIQVKHVFFPYIGEALWRRHSGEAFREAPSWLPIVRKRYSWGGETLVATTFDVPSELENKSFTISANGDDSYLFLDSRTGLRAEGVAGELLTIDHPKGPIRLFVQQLHAPDGRLFSIRKRPVQTAAKRINGRLDAFPAAGRRSTAPILKLIYTSDSPQEVTRTLGQILDVFQKQNIERRSAEAEKTLTFLENQLPELRSDVEAAESKLNQFKVSQGTADLNEETSIILKKAVELDQARSELVQQREEALRRFTENHPVVISLDEQIRRLDIQRNEVDQRVERLPDAQQQALRLNRDVEVLTALYVSLLNRAQELEIVKNGTIGNVRIIDPPVPPLGAKGINRLFIVGFPMVLSVILVVTIVLIRHLLHNGVKDPTELESRLGMPTFGVIPYSPLQDKLVKSSKDASKHALLAVSDPQSPTIEAIRSARTALSFAQMDAKNRSVMITGPVPGVGKTFVSANLACALAMTGKRVVLIDADMRRGTLHKAFAQEQAGGLSELLSEQIDLPDAIRKTEVDKLWLITAGTFPPNPAELLVGERLPAILSELEQKFDIVLLDTPPILAVTDAAIIGRMTGSNFVVLKAAEHSMRMIEDSFKRVAASGATVTGTIFNQVGRNERGRYGYMYGYGYGYSAKYGDYSQEYRTKA